MQREDSVASSKDKSLKEEFDVLREHDNERFLAADNQEE